MVLKKRRSQALVVHPCNLATQEAEMKRIEVQNQPGQRVHETLL
jgi:hypothetical protein